MIKTLSEKIKVCIAVETTTAEIYHLLSSELPEARAFWRDLALSEENHANILVAGAKYLATGELPEYIVPHSQNLIDETFRLVRDAKKQVNGDHLSLKDALSLALKIETSAAESYFQEIMLSETDSPVIAKLQKIRTDELTHIEKIENFMKTSGVNPGGIN